MFFPSKKRQSAPFTGWAPRFTGDSETSEAADRIFPVMEHAVKLILGIFLTALGVLMALDNLHIIYAHPYLRYWPLVLVAIGIAKLNDPLARTLGIASIIAGIVLLVWTTRWARFSIFDLWPLLIIAAGVLIVAQAIGYGPSRSMGGWSAVLMQRKINVDARDFRGARALVVIGGVEVDLAADIADGPAIVDLLVVMGGMEIRVPDGWEVVADAVPFMGGVEIKTQSIRTGRQLVCADW